MNDDMLLLDNQLCFALYAASRRITALYAPLFDRLGITYTQYITLMVLWETSPLPVKEIGERLLLDSGTLTPVLKKLEEKGFVSRRRQATDERVVLISLTERGGQARQTAREMLPSLVCAAGVEPEKLSALRCQVQGLLRSLEAAGQRAAEDPS